MPIDWIKDSVPNFLKVTQITRHLIKIGGHNSQNDKDEDISSTINNVNNNWEIKAEIDNRNYFESINIHCKKVLFYILNIAA